MRWPPGSCPSVEESSAVIFKAILDAAPTSAVRLNPDVPAELERVINKLWRKTAICVTSTQRTDLQRLKRDSEIGHRPAASSGTVAVRRPACGEMHEYSLADIRKLAA